MPRQANCPQVGVEMHDARIAGHDVRSCDSSLRRLVAGYMKNGTIAGLYDPEPADRSSGRAECGMQLAAVGATFATSILSELSYPGGPGLPFACRFSRILMIHSSTKMQTRHRGVVDLSYNSGSTKAGAFKTGDDRRQSGSQRSPSRSTGPTRTRSDRQWECRILRKVAFNDTSIHFHYWLNMIF